MKDVSMHLFSTHSSLKFIKNVGQSALLFCSSEFTLIMTDVVFIFRAFEVYNCTFKKNIYQVKVFVLLNSMPYHTPI